MATSDCDYIIVGSGAGGGPLAANLARAGFNVLLLEAGGDPCAENETGRLTYQVPIFHAMATEYPACEWDYFVRHYADEARQKQDTKYVEAEKGIWYPRVGALGGCTAHHAMITVLPSDNDWNGIAEITGDSSWRAERMHGYFRKMENCTYVPRPGTLAYMLQGIGSALAGLFKGDTNWSDFAHGHGFGGWLTTSEADRKLALRDPQIIEVVLKAVKESLKEHVGDALARAATVLDPNDSRNVARNPEGLAATPLSIDNGRRHGPRELILQAKNDARGRLTIQRHALATKILFDGTRAIGVEYLDGPHLYKADPAARAAGAPPAGAAPRRQVRAAKEVIVAAGAFNSPQLLKLSGVGPQAELKKFNINVVADLPGVGENLQDRYEVGIISKFKRDFRLLSGGTFALPQPGVPDPAFDEWKHGKGLYASNGSIIGIIKRSKPSRKDPDLYIFGLPGFFKGYVPGYSKQIERNHNLFTWAILKAHTNNRGGRVLLRSDQPTDWPDINFRYFAEGTDTSGEDLDSIVAGVEFVRDMNARPGGEIESEMLPGKDVTGPKLREFIQNEAWGHHASCTNKIGAENDPLAVLDSRFRVRKTQGLRVVDASVFPRIPGHFIVTPVYMISEKAADVIKQDA